MEQLVLGAEINSGKFGEVHALAGSRRGLALKLYTDAATAVENDAKVGWMIGLTPPLLEQQDRGKTYYQLAWPKEKVFDASNRFVGFTMPEVDVAHAVNLEWLIGEDNRRAKNIPQHYSFRLHVAWNLSAVFASLHKSGVCVIDVKPDNILFYQDVGYVCLLDCDSFIPTDKKQPAVGAGCTLGYILPEARRGKGYAADDFREEQDKFALAVLIFRLMNEGLHPYSGGITDAALAGRGLEWQPMIDLGLYPYGLASNPRIKPAFQSRHNWFDDSTRQLFDRAFNSKNRPSAKEWANHLAEYVGPAATKLHKCKAKPKEHVHFSKGCAACLAEDNLRKLKARSQAKAIKAARPTPPPVTPVRPTPRPLPSPPPPKPIPRGTIVGWAVGGLFALSVFSELVSCTRSAFNDMSQPVPTRSSPSGANATFTVQPFSSPVQYAVAPSPGVQQVNVRSGPGSGHSLVVQIPVGYELIGNGSAVASDGSTWISVTLPRDGWSGFVAERLLRPSAGAAQSGAQPSFACVGDLNWVERTICGDAGLAAKDREVAELYGRVLRSRVSSGARDTQRGWLEDRDRCGGSGDIPACLHSEYDRRLAALRDWSSAAAQSESPRRLPPSVSSVPDPIKVRRPSGRRSGGQGRDEYLVPTPTITCILPSGQEAQLSSDQCRQSSGVVYRNDQN